MKRKQYDDDVDCVDMLLSLQKPMKHRPKKLDWEHLETRLQAASATNSALGYVTKGETYALVNELRDKFQLQCMADEQRHLIELLTSQRQELLAQLQTVNTSATDVTKTNRTRKKKRGTKKQWKHAKCVTIRRKN